MQFRTSSLFHYTNYNNLKKILEDGLIPNFCKEDISIPTKEIIMGIPMVSFCDIPLMRTKEFSARYGRHAIGLSKEWGLKNSINPILYSSSDDIQKKFWFYKEYLVNFKSILAKIETDSIEYPELLEPIFSYSHYNNLDSATCRLLGLIKKYNSKRGNKIQNNYIENEWRYVVEDTINEHWLWSSKEYEYWRGKPTKKKPKPTSYLINEKLTFTVNDISHIILEHENQIPKFINKIQNLDFIGGTAAKVTQCEKQILLTKIISMEKIKQDF